MSGVNILDVVDSALAADDLSSEVNVLIPRTPSSLADVVLAGEPSLWKDGGAGASVAQALASREEVDVVQPRGRGRRRKLNVRLRADWLETLGDALERGRADALHVADLVPGTRIAVDFCDPNATKAFHVGHLRNLALGNAIARLTTAAGATTTTLSHVSDMGLAMGEALAGYVTHGEGATPGEAGVKGDRLVGECYARYSAAVGADRGDGEEPAFERQAIAGDLADELLRRWSDGDDEVVGLWRRLRRWVTDGQEDTLRRLGIAFDRVLLESGYGSEIGEFVDLALASGVAERGWDGSVGFATGREEYPYILLRRADRQWTQYLRCVAMWNATRSELEGGRSIQVMGDEWLAFQLHGRRILAEVDPRSDPHPTDFVVHGMVLVEGEKVSSRAGSPWLVDDLLDQIEADPRTHRLRSISPSQASALVALAFFLAHPLSKPMTASCPHLFEAHSNPGWTLVEGWEAAWDPSFDGPSDPNLEDPDYRFLLLQTQLHRRFVREALDCLDVQPLLRFHAHLCGWFLMVPHTPRLARVMRTVLREGLSTLGLITACTEREAGAQAV